MKKRVSKSSKIRAYRDNTPGFDEMSTSEIVTAVKGVTAQDVSSFRNRVKKAEEKKKGKRVLPHKKTATKRVSRTKFRNGAVRTTVAPFILSQRMSVEISEGHNLILIVNDESGKEICSLGISKEGLEVYRKEVSGPCGSVQWEPLLRMVGANFLPSIT